MSGFKDLKVWQRSKELAVLVYRLTHRGPFTKDYGFRDQIRRAAVSVPSNIAEGDERGSNKDAIRFFYFAKGSLAEIRTQIQIANDIEYLDNSAFNELDEKCIVIGKMLGSLIKARS
ncbi:MAG: four helix bundle protein [Desulfobacteraceae bacterium]|jgi:four helix bundle protein|nr:four helix bundle protein [Desulfobacteraceae bacterium]